MSYLQNNARGSPKGSLALSLVPVHSIAEELALHFNPTALFSSNFTPVTDKDKTLPLESRMAERSEGSTKSCIDLRTSAVIGTRGASMLLNQECAALSTGRWSSSSNYPSCRRHRYQKCSLPATSPSHVTMP